MNLLDTVKALEAKNITVAINLGVHQYCELDSNCPLAIQLRRLIGDSGTTLPELLEGYEAVTAPDPVRYELPHFDATACLNVAGKELTVDLDDIVSDQIKDRVRHKLRELDEMKGRVQHLGSSLYSSYLLEIARQRDNHTLPQVEYSIEELIDSGCSITAYHGRYSYLFPMDYNPQYIVRDGIRFKLSDEDIRDIRRKAYLQFEITSEDKILEPRVLDREGGKLEHYHGNSDGDCWGSVDVPETWDRRLSSLRRIVHNLTRSLATVNRGSPLMQDPPDMPNIDDIIDRGTELGREGQLDEPEERPTEGERPAGWGATHWGRRERPRQPRGTPGLTAEQEYQRRFGTATPRTGMTCMICGAEYGRHRGYQCPEEAPLTETERRFGRGFSREDMDAICTLCGEPYGGHFGVGENLICPRDHR